MRLTSHTDFGLRFLMQAAVRAPAPVSVKDVSARFGISPHHLMKVARSLTRGGLIAPMRGRAGGFRLAMPADRIIVGQVVRELESDIGLVSCLRNDSSECPITPCCRLPKLLNEATGAFFSVLDGCTLADLVLENDSLIRILGAA